ncbi:fungal hydrophobin [Macrolepiota fuliginosa MF-IS2]|uniref:Hydrophobin n=1 Tax=Macrolepiota fuliginosa MF-IS2 TaxID=1400762 RepID=A0A9P6BWX5_9AGAR|nr:fungal hydrophobin [Macrolepiota fuliginosa MF-IS2]
MFAKLAILFISAAAIVSAMPGAPAPPPAGSTTVNKTVNKCNVGSLQCCKSVQDGSDKSALNQLAALGLGAGNIKGLIGFECNPISAAIGAGTGSNCNANPVCCKGNSINGVFAGGCGSANVNV